MHQLVEKLSHTERAAVAELKALLMQQYGIQDIRLFGSKARGTGHVESDLDLFIVVPDLDWERAKAIYTLCFESVCAMTCSSRQRSIPQPNLRIPSSSLHRSTGPSRKKDCLYERGASCAGTLSP